MTRTSTIPNPSAVPYVTETDGVLASSETEASGATLSSQISRQLRIDTPGTKHAASAVSRLTYDRLEDDAGVLHFLHLSVLLVDDMSDELEDTVDSAAVWNHLSVPEKAAISAGAIQGSENLLVRFHSYEFTRLQVERPLRSWLAFMYRTYIPRKLAASPQPMELVVEPPHRAPQSDASMAEVVVHRID
jgi:hypothetical protein